MLRSILLGIPALALCLLVLLPWPRTAYSREIPAPGSHISPPLRQETTPPVVCTPAGSASSSPSSSTGTVGADTAAFDPYIVLEMVDSFGGSVRTLAHDDTYLYVGQSGTLMLYPLGGGDGDGNMTDPLAYIAFSDDIQQIFPSGNLVYVANGGGGVQVVDTSNHAALSVVAHMDTTSAATDVQVVGDLAYVGTKGAEGGLQVWNVQSPSTPWFMGEISSATLATASALDVVGNRAYVTASFGGGLHVLDVSRPYTPTLLGATTEVGTARDVQVVENVAYVAADSNGLYTLDVQSTITPTVLARSKLPGNATMVQVVGEIAYVAADMGGVHILNVSNPNRPRLLSTCTVEGGAASVDVGPAGRAYVAAQGGGMHHLQVSDPTSPTLQSSYPTLHGVENITVRHGVAFVSAGRYGLSLLGMSADDISTTLITSTRVITTTSPITPTEIITTTEIVTSTVVMTTHVTMSPTLLGSIEMTGTVVAAHPAGGHIYVATGHSGMDILSYPPYTPTLALSPTTHIPITRTGHYATPSVVSDLQVVGSLAYLAVGQSGVEIVDVSRPRSPTFVARYVTPDSALALQVAHDMAYVADTTGLHLIDVSDPYSPTLVGSILLSDDSYVQDLALSGSHVYLADAGVDGKVQIVDVSDPAHPVSLSDFWIERPGTALGVAFSDGYLYIAAGIAGIQVVDVSDPLRPSLQARHDTPGTAHHLAVVGEMVYVADYSSGVQVFRALDIEPHALYLPFVVR